MRWPNINTHAARYNNCSLRRRPFHLDGERPSVIISEWASVKSAFFTLGDADGPGSLCLYVSCARIIKIIYCASATTHVMRAAAGYGHRVSVSREGLLMILFFLRPPGWSGHGFAAPRKHETHQQVFKMIMADSFFIAQLALWERAEDSACMPGYWLRMRFDVGIMPALSFNLI